MPIEPVPSLPAPDEADRTRRRLVCWLPLGPLALCAGWPSLTRADDPLMAETDGEALAVDYKADAAEVDHAKYPGSAGQTCANCGLYAGEPGQASGGCALFLGKQVTAKGWCNAWEKKGL